MKQVVLKKGRAVVERVPSPAIEPGTILVAVEYSCISIGTEMSSLSTTSMPLWERALKQPENVKKGLESVAAIGVQRTWSMIQGRLESGNATGYSAAGTILEVAPDVTNFKVGDRIACAGAQCAHHASIIRVPKNLAVKVPEVVDLRQASTVTLGAIALQGVRRAAPTLGETIVVVGLGILGQITMQLLRANGCRVIGTDLDPSRVRLAKSAGMEFGLDPSAGTVVEQIYRLTDGYGADGVIITAASPSNEIISNAFKSCRKKGRVVLVGDVGLQLNRGDFFQKEIDFLISSSYGPGRYDARYEDEGLDYPIGYVRWTENRNLLEYLRLIGDGKIQLGNLGHAEFLISDAEMAYEHLRNESERPLLVFLKYPKEEQEEARLEKVANNPHANPIKKERIGVAIVGAGGFAKGMHLPNLQKLHGTYELRAIASRTGLNADSTAKQFGAQYGTTDFNRILEDKQIDAVIIATRHHLHAVMALAALKAGKHVLLEKPMALAEDEIESIVQFFKQAGPGAPQLLTGFNRRFSRHIQEAKKALQGRSNPLIINYRMNAGYIPLDHWVHGKEGGGRNLGEACHIYDLFAYLTASRPLTVTTMSLNPKTSAYSARDNFVATIAYEDGSVATLTYTALGAKLHPKEQMEVFFDGKVITMDDFKTTRITGAKSPGYETKISEKGQLEELTAFAECLKTGDWAIPLNEQIETTRVALAVDHQLAE
ncbi:MAG: bi-domain-containing oxidoreductase [Deltaproteobacteria bacterium]|nr:bi-domain-containing oxidoreductase [Deltaproteobacteria bacterium]